MFLSRVRLEDRKRSIGLGIRDLGGEIMKACVAHSGCAAKAVGYYLVITCHTTLFPNN